MGWGNEIGFSRQFVRLVVVLVFGALTAGCFQPLYGERTLAGGESLRDRLAAVEVVPIAASNGTPQARLAVELRNKLMYDLDGGAAATTPTHRLKINLSSGITTVIVNVKSGLPGTQVEAVNASFTLTEIATKRVVLRASTFARASFDMPGSSAQRFAQERAWRNAQDRAIGLIARNIRNRLASYFVAGT